MIDIRPDTPFIFLTARKLKADKIKGLKLGADDYIVKPFEADELVLRLQNILKRHHRNVVTTTEQETINIGEYLFYPKRSELCYQNDCQRLTKRETELIHFLYQHKNELLKRQEVLQAVWGNDDFFSGRSMDVFISKLRKLFKQDARIRIESIRGVGLEFKVDPY